MAFSKIISESLDLTDDYAFTGTVTGAGESNTPAFKVTMSGSQTFTNNAYTKMDFDTETYDTDGAYDTSNQRFTVPSGKAGKYFFYAQTIGIMTDNNTEVCVIRFLKNGSTQLSNAQHNRDGVATDTTFFGQCIVDLSVGDYVEAYLFQNQGSNRGNDATTSFTFWEGFRVHS